MAGNDSRLNWPHEILTNSPYKGELRFLHYFIATKANRDGTFIPDANKWAKWLNMTTGELSAQMKILQEDSLIELDYKNHRWNLLTPWLSFTGSKEPDTTDGRPSARVHVEGGTPSSSEPVFPAPRGNQADDAVQPTLDGREPPSKGPSRIPADWEPTDEDLNLARKSLPLVDTDAFVGAFRDHWLSGNRRRVSWDATFREWVRRVQSNGWAYPKRARSEWS